MHLILTAAIILFSTSSYSEYRVFTLKIINQKMNTSRTIKSTLDPEQYKAFFPLSPEESITYTKTWRCRGATRDYMALCEAPIRGELQPENTSQNVQN